MSEGFGAGYLVMLNIARMESYHKHTYNKLTFKEFLQGTSILHGCSLLIFFKFFFNSLNWHIFDLQDCISFSRALK